MVHHRFRSVQATVLRTQIPLIMVAALALIGSVPFAPTIAYAAGSIWCVRASGGPTLPPCKNPQAYTTIQEAVNKSEGKDDQIRIATGTYVGDREGLPVVLTYGQWLTITGGYENNNWTTPTAQPSATIIDGQGVRRGVNVQRNSVVTISNLTITNSNAKRFENTVYDGGGVFAGEIFSTLVLDNTIITNNVASNEGGGVYPHGGRGERRRRAPERTAAHRADRAGDGAAHAHGPGGGGGAGL